VATLFGITMAEQPAHNSWGQRTIARSSICAAALTTVFCPSRKIDKEVGYMRQLDEECLLLPKVHDVLSANNAFPGSFQHEIGAETCPDAVCLHTMYADASLQKDLLNDSCQPLPVKADAAPAASTEPPLSVGRCNRASCKPCVFDHRGLCTKGDQCGFCHLQHSARQIRQVKPSKVTRHLLKARQHDLQSAQEE